MLVITARPLATGAAALGGAATAASRERIPACAAVHLLPRSLWKAASRLPASPLTPAATLLGRPTAPQLSFRQHMSLLAPPARAAAGAGAASAQARALLRISVCTASSSPHRHGSDQPAPLPAKSRWRPDLTENIYTAANGLTVSRILMTPVIGYLIVQQSFVSACSLLAIAALTDLLDGYLARNFDQKTVLGSVLDPAADKILMTTLTVSLCQAGLLPLALAVLIIGRDVGLVLGTAYYRYISLQPPVSVSSDNIASQENPHPL
nr:hypothetical protein HK105_002427 [Polyrhizophydium stewartii]